MVIGALILLAAVFATAGAHHILIWMRHSAGREHLWFALTCFSAAGAAAAHAVAPDTVSANGLSAELPGLPASVLAWLVAVAWFTAEYAGGNHPRRRAALAVTLLLTVAALGNALPLFVDISVIAIANVCAAAAFAALILLLGLALGGARRLWFSAARFRGSVLAVGVGLVVVAAMVQLVVPQLGTLEMTSLTLSAFLVTVGMMMYELAGTVADGRAAAKRQQQELAHASRLSIVGELTASIAHEINQPLGAILSNVDAGEILLDRADPPLDEIRHILADVRRDGLRASDVIRHVRTLVRKRELEMEKLDANAIAADVIALLEPEARRRRIPVASVLSPQHAYVRGDRAHLEQVLINLMLNAMDAVEAMSVSHNGTTAPAPIVIGVSGTSHREIEIWISDAGPGVPAEQLSHLFDSFYTSKPHGMGLGLSIARSIVEAHGGRIRVENNRDSGATFKITLPPYDDADG
ncbi:sensor histidine kinase [Pseudoxanthomonas sp. UTMC 1351]|uniref:sensor histidine kinase n=1 Tax=Pseudoxanthomonas sp. UTMC 1351 TaxID=2695853 RepID=UPI0034CEDFFB